MQEGVIKFKIKNMIKTGSLPGYLWYDLESAREELYGYKLIGYNEKLKLGYGNISKRIKQDSQFIISGSQTGKLNRLNGNHYSIIKEVDFNENSVVCEGPVKPSSESISHAACYNNPEINTVIHIHEKNIWKKLIKANYTATPENAEYGSILLSKSLSELTKKTILPVIIVMKGHEEGIIIASNTIISAMNKTIELYNKYIK